MFRPSCVSLTDHRQSVRGAGNAQSIRGLVRLSCCTPFHGKSGANHVKRALRATESARVLHGKAFNRGLRQCQRFAQSRIFGKEGIQAAAKLPNGNLRLMRCNLAIGELGAQLVMAG